MSKIDKSTSISDEDVSTSSNTQKKLGGKPKQKVLLFLLVFLLLISGLAWWFVFHLSKDAPTSTDQPYQQPNLLTSKAWLINLKDSTYQISSDGSEVKKIDAIHSGSPAGNFLIKRTKAGIEIASASTPTNFTQIYKKPKNAEDVDFIWFPDESELIVSYQSITNKPVDPETPYIPDIFQEFFRIKPDGSNKTKLFEQKIQYGSATVFATDPARDEFYWRVSGEGGGREALNVSKLSTGKLVKKYQLNYDTFDIEIDNGIAYFTVEDEVKSLSLDDGKINTVKALFNDPANKMLTEDCTIVSSIDDIAIDYSKDQLLVSTAANKPHEIQIIELPFEVGEDTNVIFKESSLRQIAILAVDERKILFAKQRTNTCNAKGEDFEKVNLFMLDRNTGENREVSVEINEQSFNSAATFIKTE